MYVKCADMGRLVPFLPEYIYRESVSLLDRGSLVIYSGRMDQKVKVFLEKEVKFFIANGAPVEFDLNDHEQFMKFFNVFKPGHYSSKVINLFKPLTDDDFDNEVKRYWVLKRTGLEESEDLSIYELFKATLLSPREQIKTFLELHSIPFPVIESSYITFLTLTYGCKSFGTSSVEDNPSFIESFSFTTIGLS